LADEPTGNLDTYQSLEIMKLLSTLNQNSNLTVIMVTHEENMAEYAHSKVHFADGQIKKTS
jgi:putative ABC transport system ATP-binding protein